MDAASRLLGRFSHNGSVCVCVCVSAARLGKITSYNIDGHYQVVCLFRCNGGGELYLPIYRFYTGPVAPACVQ